MMTAVIPVRSDSRRIPNKNLAPFGDSNLLIHKIRQLKRTTSVDVIVVSSDSDTYLALAREEGVAVHKRARPFAVEGEGQVRSFGEVVRHVAENVEGDHIAWCQCTSPLVTSELYQDAITTYYARLGEYDSLASVLPFQRHVWDERGPVNYERGPNHLLSQELPVWYFVTGVFIAPRSKMVEWSHNIGPNPFKYALPRINAIDVDDLLDLSIARSWHDRVCDCTAGESRNDGFTQNIRAIDPGS